jgi:hypothetical protein
MHINALFAFILITFQAPNFLLYYELSSLKNWQKNLASADGFPILLDCIIVISHWIPQCQIRLKLLYYWLWLACLPIRLSTRHASKLHILHLGLHQRLHLWQHANSNGLFSTPFSRQSNILLSHVRNISQYCCNSIWTRQMTIDLSNITPPCAAINVYI